MLTDFETELWKPNFEHPPIRASSPKNYSVANIYHQFPKLGKRYKFRKPRKSSFL